MNPTPLYFGSEERPLFGWLHRASAPSDLGLVVCNPFGYEAVCAHRSLRLLAESAADAGVSTLRFDYDGTGDSAGDDRDAGRFAAWVRSVRDAALELRRRGGVRRVALLGVRLGALIAAVAAMDWDAADGVDLEGLIALAPVIVGRLHLRELRALQMALGLAAPPIGVTVDERIQEVVGFAITEETKNAISAVDLTKATKPPGRAVLLLDRDDLPGSDKWAAQLTTLGAQVEGKRLPGYVEMMLDPHKAVPPDAMIAAAVDWLGRRARGTHAAAAAEPPAVATARLRIGDVVISERAQFVDEAQTQVFGIVSAPSGPPTGRGVLLLNAGAVHHIGPNRLYVELARRWAARGHLVVRLDNSGIGDSPVRHGEEENVVYSSRAREDVAAAVAFLRRQPGIGDCTAIGLCSGAYNAFKAAVEGMPLDSVVIINPLTFFWKDGMPLDYPQHRVVDEAQRYSQAALQLDKWKKLLRGEVNVRVAAETMARHAAGLAANRARDVARRVGLPLEDDLGSELDTIVRHRIALDFVFAAADPGPKLLAQLGGSVIRALVAAHKVGIHTIDGPDHTFTPLWSHAALTRVLDGALTTPTRG